MTLFWYLYCSLEKHQAKRQLNYSDVFADKFEHVLSFELKCHTYLNKPAVFSLGMCDLLVDTRH